MHFCVAVNKVLLGVGRGEMSLEIISLPQWSLKYSLGPNILRFIYHLCSFISNEHAHKRCVYFMYQWFQKSYSNTHFFMALCHEMESKAN